MYRYIFFLFLVIATFNIYSAKEVKLDFRDAMDIYKLQESGMQHYRDGSYDSAYEELIQSAEAGLKYSQYYLGLMYLKGQGVSKSNLTGMAWLGVAKESKIREIVELYDSVYEKFSKEKRKFIDDKVLEFTSLYGLKAQDVSCKRRKTARSMRPRVYCVKNTKDIQKFIFR